MSVRINVNHYCFNLALHSWQSDHSVHFCSHNRKDVITQSGISLAIPWICSQIRSVINIGMPYLCTMLFTRSRMTRSSTAEHGRPGGIRKTRDGFAWKTRYWDRASITVPCEQLLPSSLCMWTVGRWGCLPDKVICNVKHHEVLLVYLDCLLTLFSRAKLLPSGLHQTQRIFKRSLRNATCYDILCIVTAGCRLQSVTFKR